MRGGRSRQYQGAYFRLLCAVFTYLLCPHPVKVREHQLSPFYEGLRSRKQ